jgi:hypothetical protein
MEGPEMCKDCGGQGIEAACTACGVKGYIGTSVIDVLERLAEAGWGVTECGTFLCPSCLQRISNRLAMMANAGLN